jgi:hypothetical protein
MRHEAAYPLSPPRRYHRIGFVVLTLLGGLIAIAAMRASHDEHSSPAIAEPTFVPTRVPPPDPIPASDVAAAEALLADVYPSRQSAVRALARRVPDAVAVVAENPAKFRLNFEDRPTTGGPVYDVIRKHFPNTRIASEAVAGPKPADEVVIELRLDDQPAKSGRPVTKGNVQLSIAGPSRSTSLSVKFTQCDWADDLTTYVNENPGHNWIVVRSRRPGLTPAEAKRSAEQNAADVLDRLARERNARRAGPSPSQPPIAPAQWVDARQLPITDRFVQRFRRPYGDVWEEAILLDASPQWMDASRRREATALFAAEARARNTVASTAVVLLAILAAYAFANVVTKRYFTGRLRAVAITAALAAVAVAVVITVA